MIFLFSHCKKYIRYKYHDNNAGSLSFTEMLRRYDIAGSSNSQPPRHNTAGSSTSEPPIQDYSHINKSQPEPSEEEFEKAQQRLESCKPSKKRK
jgi:hypothetical protein